MEIKPLSNYFYGTPFVDKCILSRVSVGARIRMLRKEKGWKLRELAEASGVPASTISDLEHGRSSNSVGPNLVKLAAALQVDTGWLQTGNGLPMRKAEPRIDESEILRVYGLLSNANREALLATAKALLGSQGGTRAEAGDTIPPRPRKLQ